MKTRIVIKYKEFLFEALDNMCFEDIMSFYKALCSDAYETEEHWGAPVTRTDKVIERKAEIIWEYINKHYPNRLKEYYDDEDYEQQ